MNIATRIGAGLALLALTPTGVNAASVAFDSAADPVYNAGWSNGQNGGFGFQPWGLSGNGAFSHFTASSVQNGDGVDDGATRGAPNDRDIDTAGRSWGMFSGGTSNDLSTAARLFTGGQLDIGQSAIVDLDNGFIDPQGTVGVFFGTINGAGLVFTGGGSNYTAIVSINGANTFVPTTLGFADEGLTLTMTRTAATDYTMTATLRNGDSQTFLGDMYFDPLDRISFVSRGVGGGAANDHFINSITVTPEPVSTMLIAVAGAALFTRRR